MAWFFDSSIMYCSGAIGMGRAAAMEARKTMSEPDIIYLSVLLIWIVLVVLLYLILDLPRRVYEYIKKRLKAEILSYKKKKKGNGSRK